MKRRRISLGSAAVLAAALVAVLAVRGVVRPGAAAQGSPPRPPLTQAPDGRRLVLTFSDEFDTLRLWNGRTGSWRPTYGDGQDERLGRRTLTNNREREIYVDPAYGDDAGRFGLNPFSTRGGVLSIVADRAPSDLVPRLHGYRYTSGVITTQPSFSQRYGYFEMRARIPGGKGVWPAFWLLPADMSWPPEIDVMESVGDPATVYMTVHAPKQKKGAKSETAKVAPGAFHTFAVAWDPRELVWYIDGREAARKPTPPGVDQPMFLIANLALGGYWPGDPDETTPLPVTFAIDYIRAYRFAP
ncbi:MAG: glycoside hydrolase family 16 protein [Parcubacteria group bacterium]